MLIFWVNSSDLNISGSFELAALSLSNSGFNEFSKKKSPK